MNQNLDEKQTQLAAALRGEKTTKIQKFAELQKTDPSSALSYALDSGVPELADIAKESLKGHTLAPGAVHVSTDLGGNQTRLEGNPDLPESIKYAISVGQLPSNPATWTSQQAGLAKQLVESKGQSTASRFDFSNMLGKSTIGEVGPMLKESKAAAVGAVEQATAANRILNALDSNKAFTGTGANQKLAINQIGQLLGVTGENAQQQATATRDAIQGLAQLTLAGRKQMKGQGAVTESEGKLAERALGGDINFTTGELRQLAGSAKRSAKFTYQQHEGMVGALKKDNPNAVPYYEIQGNTNVFEPNQQRAIPARSNVVNEALSIIQGK
jgi:hypothetical protein